jgi:splicing factor 3A subunit 2
MSESAANADRRERLRKLALETIDLNKDPYYMLNHLGKAECKLCLTLHNNEGNYLAHTQGKKHQQNLARRAAMEARNAAAKPMPTTQSTQGPTRKAIKIGRPGYRVTKSRDLRTRQRSLLFELEYPEAEAGVQPRHRFMSAYEQRVEVPDRDSQYILFACDPYENVAFKIPNEPIDKAEGRFFTNWDKNSKKFSLQLHFVEQEQQGDAE